MCNWKVCTAVPANLPVYGIINTLHFSGIVQALPEVNNVVYYFLKSYMRFKKNTHLVFHNYSQQTKTSALGETQLLF